MTPDTKPSSRSCKIVSVESNNIVDVERFVLKPNLLDCQNIVMM